MGALDTAISGLLAARAGLEVASNNLANVNTPGYARRRIQLSSASAVDLGDAGVIGGGVSASVERYADAFLDRRLNAQAAAATYGQVLDDGLAELEGLLPDLEGVGLSSSLSEVERAALALTANPTEPGNREAFLAAASAFSNDLNQTANSLDRYGRDLEAGLEVTIDRVNDLAKQAAELNVQITASEASGLTGNDLRDRRAVILRELHELVGGDVISDGTVERFFVAGRQLVGSNEPQALEVSFGSASPSISLAGSPITPSTGKVGAQLQLINGEVAALREGLDGLAATVAQAFDSAHTISIGTAGAFSDLIGTTSLGREVSQPELLGTALADADLRFPIQAGQLTVAVEDVATGEIATTALAIDPDMTVGQLLSDLSAIDGLQAGLSDNRLALVADPGRRFSFAPVPTTHPDTTGSFGGAQGTLLTNTGPFALTVPSSLSITVDGGAPQVVNLTAADFADPGAATPEELVAVLNSTLTGAQAVEQHGRLVLQSNTAGSASTVAVAAGAAAAAMGLSGATDAGNATAVAPTIGGRYTGTDNQVWEVVALDSGTVGAAGGLRLEVRSEGGLIRERIDVGAGYVPGQPIALLDGLTIALEPGELRAGDAFVVRADAQPDTSGVLVGLGLNTLFQGSSARDLAVRGDVLNNASLLATARSHQTSDGGGAQALADAAGLNDETGLRPIDVSTSLLHSVGRHRADARNQRDINETLLISLEGRRDAVSGVSIDEEASDLLRFQRAYEAAARVIQTTRDLDQILFSILQ